MTSMMASWPPTDADLDAKSPHLEKFLNFVTSGDTELEKSRTIRRIVLTIGHVINISHSPR